MTYKRFFFFAFNVILSVSLSSTAFSETHSKSTCIQTGSPVFTIIAPKVPLPNLQSGEVKTFEFDVKNVSDRDIDIRKLKANCSCTSPSIEPKMVKAGKTAKLTLHVDTTGRSGSLNLFPLAVVTADEKTFTIESDLKVTLSKNIVLSPVRWDFIGVPKDQSAQSILELKFDRPVDSSSIEVFSGDKIIRCTLLPVKDNLNKIKELKSKYKNYKILIDITATFEEKFITRNVELLIKDFDGRNRVFDIPVTIQKTPDVRILPKRIFLGIMQEGVSKHKKFTIKHSLKKDISLRKIIAPKGIEIEYSAKNALASMINVDIDIKLNTINEVAGEFSLSCMIDSPKDKEVIELPCFFVSGN
jgi:hypothetical protein